MYNVKLKVTFIYKYSLFVGPASCWSACSSYAPHCILHSTHGEHILSIRPFILLPTYLCSVATIALPSVIAASPKHDSNSKYWKKSYDTLKYLIHIYIYRTMVGSAFMVQEPSIFGNDIFQNNGRKLNGGVSVLFSL